MNATRGSSRTEKQQSILETIHIHENNINGMEDHGAAEHETSQKSGTPKNEVQLSAYKPESEITIVETHNSNNIKTRGRTKKSANTRARMSSKATKKKRDELAQESLRESVQQFINFAKYEIEVDPYRGIFDRNEENPKTFSSCSNVFSDSCDEDILSSCDDKYGMNQIILDIIQCPSVKSWLRHEIEKKEAAALRAKKAKRRRSVNGKKQKSKSKKQKKAETEIVLLDEGNENEILVENDNNAASQKDGSCDSGEDNSSENEHVEVHRKTKTGFFCACDFNPFCMFSMGGVIDAYMNGRIRERCKIVKGGSCGKKAIDGVTLMDIDTNATSVDINSFHLNGRSKGVIQAGWTKSDDDVIMVDTACTSKDMSIANPTEKSSDSDEDNIQIMMGTSGNNTAPASRRNPSTTQSGHSHVVGELLQRDSVELKLDANMSTTVDLDLRKCINVDIQRISDYLKSVGISEGEIDKSLAAIVQWHRDIAYGGQSHSEERDQTKGDEMFTFCRPVGMRNLGATCYLNSQLQCLVANLEFIQGVFGWAKDADLNSAHSNDQMTVVLSQMQTLLARMIYGPQTVVCTDDFSRALCLENNEMQDPNEFARLLFDRMHESFQMNSTASNGNKHGLKDLLPRIFSGTFEYTTKCLECSNISTREEKFMDLNLPIQSPKEASGSSKEVTVEFLLERYLEPEKLDGANKYQCNYCNKTCEAERRVTIAQCPPVLNFQLARYIFDRKTFRKQKLLDKILLPRTIEVDKQNAQKGLEYILCGVQNHRGSSAYSGHYVAEVMDWTTGVWFEYDDEKVNVLDHPTSSYDPRHTQKTRLQGGTTDAYNLFYVEKSFLHQKIKNKIELLLELPSKGIIQQISRERQKAYTLQKEIQLQKEKDMQRLNCRRSGILRNMLRLEPQSYSSGIDEKVWVEGGMLRRFFSCTDTMDDIFENSACGPILKHKHLLCTHQQGLHPRIARRGKLLSKSQFIAYTELLQTECEMYMENKGIENSHICTADVCDLIISTEKNLYCEVCATEYRDQLKKKVDTYDLVTKLYDSLDPINEDLDRTCNENLFAVSKSFITNFRKFAIKKMKLAMDMMGCSASQNLTAPDEGIDHFDINEILPCGSSPDIHTEVEIVSTSNEKDAIDPLVNSKITCQHRGCNVFNNKRLVRLVSSSTWKDLCSLFPDAIPHPVTRLEDGFQNCIVCQEEKDKTSRLSSWADSKPTVDITDFTSEESRNKLSRFYLVHSDNIRIWKRAREIVKRSRKRKGSVANTEKLKNQILCLLTPCSQNQKNDEPISIRHCLHRLTCTQHNKVLHSMKFVQDLLSDTKSDTVSKDASDIPISLMIKQEFLTYSSSLSHLEEILFGNGKDELQTFLHQSSPQLLVSGGTIDDRKKLKDVTDIVTAKSCWLNDGGKIEFVDDPCRDENCNAQFLDYIHNTLSNGKASPSKEKNNRDEEVPPVRGNGKYSFHVHEFSSSIDRKTSEGMLGKQRVEGIQTAIRRSARRRGAMPGVNLFSLETNKSDNLAQLRLRVYESSNSKSLSTHALSIFYFVEASKEGVMMELLGEWNERKIDEILASLPFKVTDDPTITLVLNTQENEDQIKTSGERKERDDSLFDLLVNMATFSDKGETFTPKNGRGRRRREERGFAGTFLQSSFNAPPPITNENTPIAGKFEDKVSTIDLTGTSETCDLNEVVIDESNTENNSHSIGDNGKVALDQDQCTEEKPPATETKVGLNVASEVSDTFNVNPKMVSTIACIYNTTTEEWSNLSPMQLCNASMGYENEHGKCPKVPEYAHNILNLTSDDVNQILERGKGDNDDDRESLKQQLLFSSEVRNLFRNFMDHPPINSGNDLPISRREMDIILYSIKKEDNSSSKRLIPYRSDRYLKYLFKILQETNIVFDSEYEGYMGHVASYVGKIDQLEEKRIVAVGRNM